MSDQPKPTPAPALHLYRCVNSACKTTEFTAPAAICPTCAADGPLVHQLAIIHFDPPSRYPHRGLGHCACDPKTHIGRKRGTGEHSVVNCPACKATKAYRESLPEYDGAEAVKVPDQDAEFEVTHTANGPVVTKG